MATNFTMRTSIVRASSGKCAVASAAYQSAENLHDDKLGKSFCYKTKEEVVHKEILLPQNAPHKYNNRETLWNAVERDNDRINSRWARQFIIAIPNEWTRDEAIERTRAYIRKEFVDKGLCADWAYHEKPGNHHVHLMTTTREIDINGKWMPSEKKAYALDANGNKIPIIDPKTGEQKVRERDRNGVHTRELCWQRITVQANDWNKKAKLRELKSAWADHCNQYLPSEEHIDPRSYEERGIDRIPEIHEGPASRMAAERGIKNQRMEENEERHAINRFMDKLPGILDKAKTKIKEFIHFLTERRQKDDKRRRGIEEGSITGNDVDVGRQHTASGADEGRAIPVRPESDTCREHDPGTEGRDKSIEQFAEQLSASRRILEKLGTRNRTLARSLGRTDERERSITEITRRANEIIGKRRQADERREQIKRTLLGGMGGAADASARTRAVHGAVEQDKGTEGHKHETGIRHHR